MKQTKKQNPQKEESWSEPVRPFTEPGHTQRNVDGRLAKQGYDDDAGLSGAVRDQDEKAKANGEKLA